MKKLALTIAIVLGLSMTTFADGGGLFQRGANVETTETTTGSREGIFAPRLPDHGQNTNQSAPLGSGAAILLGLGAAYLIGKKRNNE